MPRVLVTGATGFAGSHLLERLPLDCDVIAWARPGGHHAAEATGTQAAAWRAVDLMDRDGVETAIAEARPDVVYHLAGAPHVGSSFDNPVLPLEINALGTHHLLSAVERRAPAARVLVVTSAMVYGRSDAPLDEASPIVPSSPYGLSKLAQDRLAALAAVDGLQTVIARAFNHTGPRQDPSFSVPGFARQIARIEAGLDEPVLRVGNLDAERDLSDVRDVVDAYMVIAGRGTAGEAYNVCGGVAYRIGELLDGLLSRSRVRVRVEQDPDRMRPADLPRLVGDNRRLRALGWEPRVSLDTLLDDVLEYWRSRTS